MKILWIKSDVILQTIHHFNQFNQKKKYAEYNDQPFESKQLKTVVEEVLKCHFDENELDSFEVVIGQKIF